MQFSVKKEIIDLVVENAARTLLIYKCVIHKIMAVNPFFLYSNLCKIELLKIEF